MPLPINAFALAKLNLLPKERSFKDSFIYIICSKFSLLTKYYRLCNDKPNIQHIENSQSLN
jgi:hypothetical protein